MHHKETNTMRFERNNIFHQAQLREQKEIFLAQRKDVLQAACTRQL